MTYKVYKKHNNSTKEDHFFVGFEDYSNFGHGSDSDTISTHDSRYCLGGTRCHDIAGEQTFLPFLLTEIKSVNSKNDKDLLDAALKHSGLDNSKLIIVKNSINIDISEKTNKYKRK